MPGIFFSFSGKEIRVANECMRYTLNHSLTCSKMVSPWSQWITVSTHWRRGQRCKGMVLETSRPRLLDSSLKILDGKLPWGSKALLHDGCVIFSWGTELPNLRFANLQNMAFWLRSPNLMPEKFSHYGTTHLLPNGIVYSCCSLITTPWK